MEEIDVRLGGIIKAKRRKLGMTQSELADKVGTTKQCIYYYEKGLRGVTISMFFQLCDVLNLDPNEVQKELTG